MSIRLIDTHAHLDFEEFSEDRAEVISRSFKVGVEKIINIGCDRNHFKSTLELATGHEKIYAVIGVHPHEAVSLYTADTNKPYEENLETMIKGMEGYLGYKKLVAIGEIGLDFFRIAPEKGSGISLRNLQEQLFKAQIGMAIKAKFPIIIHSRESYDKIINIINEYKSKSELVGVIHSFEGSYEEAKRFIDLGFMISFNGIITYERSHDSLEAIKKIPLTSMMLETDCPYLTPEPLRGQRNEPAYVEYVATKVSALRDVSIEEVAQQTTVNAIDFFKLK